MAKNAKIQMRLFGWFSNIVNNNFLYITLHFLLLCRVLSKNELKKIDVQALASLSHLSSLDLSHNQLQEILTLNGLNQLQELFLQGNKINSIQEKALASMSNLITLNLNFNELMELPINVFEDLTNLRNLTLSSNQLESLAKDVFRPLSNLVKLHLDSNRLKILPEGISYLKNLQYL